jgi:hypothetical protein
MDEQRSFIRKVKSELRGVTDEQALAHALRRIQHRCDAVRQGSTGRRGSGMPADVAWQQFKRAERHHRSEYSGPRDLDLSALTNAPVEDTVFHSKLSARLQWTKNVESRIRASEEHSAAETRKIQAETEAHVAALAKRLLPIGQSLRLTGKLVGQESELTTANRHGAKDALVERGFVTRKSQGKPDRRLGGRRSAELSNTEKIVAMQGRLSAPPIISLNSVGAAKRFAKQWRQKATEQASKKGGSIRDQIPRGCLPQTILLRSVVDASKTGESLHRASFIDTGDQNSAENSAKHAREWARLDARAAGIQSVGETIHEISKGLTQQIAALSSESARIDSTLATRTRVLRRM